MRRVFLNARNRLKYITLLSVILTILAILPSLSASQANVAHVDIKVRGNTLKITIKSPVDIKACQIKMTIPIHITYTYEAKGFLRDANHLRNIETNETRWFAAYTISKSGSLIVRFNTTMEKIRAILLDIDLKDVSERNVGIDANLPMTLELSPATTPTGTAGMPPSYIPIIIVTVIVVAAFIPLLAYVIQRRRKAPPEEYAAVTYSTPPPTSPPAYVPSQPSISVERHERKRPRIVGVRETKRGEQT